MTPELVLTLLQTVTSVILLLFTPQILQFISQKRSTILIITRSVGGNATYARNWRIEIVINKPIYDVDKLLLIPLYRNGKFFYCREIKLRRDPKRVNINDSGFIEIDLSYSQPSRKIKINCYLNKPDAVEIYSRDNRVRVERYFPRNKNNNFDGADQLWLLEAQWRAYWIFRTFLVIALGTIGRILYLGIVQNGFKFLPH